MRFMGNYSTSSQTRTYTAGKELISSDFACQRRPRASAQTRAAWLDIHKRVIVVSAASQATVVETAARWVAR
jgi:hypothetical protein